MKKLVAGLVACSLALMVGCQGSSSSGSTTKKSTTTPTGTTKETKTEPDTKPADKAPEAGKEKPPV